MGLSRKLNYSSICKTLCCRDQEIGKVIIVERVKVKVTRSLSKCYLIACIYSQKFL